MNMRRKRYRPFFFLNTILLWITVYTEALEKGSSLKFEEEDIEIVLRSHNQLRAFNITPVASDMRELTWDDDLAKYAEKWVTNCEYLPIENTETELWKKIGQNVFLAAAPWGHDYHYSSAMKWYGENSHYNYNSGSCSDSCDHYLQFAYSETYKVGCAASFCKVVTASGNRTVEEATYYMCVYYPAAPDGEYKPYKTGTECSNCSDPTDICNDFKLCSNSGRDISLREKREQEIRESIEESDSSDSKGWTLLQNVIAGVGGGAALLGIIGSIIKLNKGTSVGPSAAHSQQQPNASNGKAPTTPAEGGN